VGFSPDLPDSNGDGLPRSNFRDLGKSLSARRDTYIEESSIVETSIEENAKSRERNACELCPWDAGPWEEVNACPDEGIKSKRRSDLWSFKSVPIDRDGSTFGRAADTSVLLADLESLTRGEPAAKRS
jgi:hypothetical protein